MYMCILYICTRMKMNCFAHIVVNRPYVILIAVTVFSVTCLIISLLTMKMPNFSDPQLGFETRGTVLSQRRIAWHNLIDATSYDGLLSVNPKISNIIENIEKPTVKMKNKKKVKNQIIIDDSQDSKSDGNSTKNNLKKKQSKWETILNLKLPNHAHFNHEHVSSDGFFCGVPGPEYAHVVLTSTDNSSLFTYRSLMAICRIEREMAAAEGFSSLCQVIKPGLCCHAWSLPNYIAQINNRTSCLSIMEEDINKTISLLQRCSQYYHNLQLAMSNHVPIECKSHDTVYNIFNYIIDRQFLTQTNLNNVFLKYTILYLPIASSTAALSYYHNLEYSNRLEYHNVKVIAMEFGLKESLFEEYLLKDAWYIVAGLLFILFCMWIYTDSLFITFMTVVAIIFSLGIAYFIYSLIFELKFFPFMNLLATVVSVGIGADDAFIFCKVWNCRNSDKYNNSLVKLVSDTLHHAVLSMFVTSLTTASALYASQVSSITAICCFSIFAGTAVMTNFILMVTWLPACLVISHHWSATRYCRGWGRNLCNYKNKVLQNWYKIFDHFIVTLVIKLRWLWITSLGGIAMLSLIVIFHHPKLSLPDSPYFQLFDKSHLFEQYDIIAEENFAFKQMQNGDKNAEFTLPLRFVWGIMPVDNGDYLDPHSKGTLKFDKTFDMAAPESQKWLLKFCREIRSQPFYQSTLGPLLPNCFIESFMSWMQRRCLDSIDNIDRTPCCEKTLFPYEQSIFNKCIVEAISDLYATPSEIFIPGVAGPKFSKGPDPVVKAVVVEYDSNYTYSMSFTEMDKFYNSVESWTQEQLKQAPPAMKNGWFISELEFYDLQKTLSQSTLIAIGASMCIALVVLLVVTLNVLISFYVILTITCSIFVTIAVLILSGWKLNVLESVAISTAVGLAVDFSLHYGVNYVLSNESEDRISATKFALFRMAGPTAMAGLTTGAAGVLMLPSSILAYTQIGKFLVLIMGVSWVYSTFLLGSILAVAGPQNGFGQLRYSCRRNSSKRKNENDDTAENRSDSGINRVTESHELDAMFVNPMRFDKPTHNCTHNDRAMKSVLQERSPSAASAITVVMTEHDEPEPKLCTEALDGLM